MSWIRIHSFNLLGSTGTYGKGTGNVLQILVPVPVRIVLTVTGHLLNRMVFYEPERPFMHLTDFC